MKASGTQPASIHFAAAKAAADAGDQEAATALAALIRDGFSGDGDPDLERLGCVVSDEIHYINDVDRGAVWEETLMHLPASIQCAPGVPCGAFDSCPSHDDVGGFFFAEEAVRTASSISSRDLARNALNIENETTHFIVRWRRVASMAYDLRKATGRRARP